MVLDLRNFHLAVSSVQQGGRKRDVVPANGALLIQLELAWRRNLTKLLVPINDLTTPLNPHASNPHTSPHH